MIPLFVGYAAMLVLLSGLKSSGLFLTEIYALEHWMGGDKWMHFTLAMLLALFANMAAQQRLKLGMLKRVIVLMLLLSLALVMDETHQYFIASRRFDWGDTVSGCAGLLVGTVMYVLSVFVLRRLKRPAISDRT
ncbi:MAG: hypothetical protein CMI02_15070 [Oceanospirillaceae bacterium]|nr:hypothetical protein [Oceanospirillaceae bacterium]MBT13345.1 hypothetical protein [Oceanospirillaceae bacterium]|tara:strand:+ start:22283 stop:22684 length:402 start_codon:yes stop_codon:yes gene_type:complete